MDGRKVPEEPEARAWQRAEDQKIQPNYTLFTSLGRGHSRGGGRPPKLFACGRAPTKGICQDNPAGP